MNDGMPQPGGVRAEDLSNGTVLLTLESDDGKPFILAESCILALEREISILEGHDSLRGVLIHAEHKSIFCAGADIDAIATVTEREEALAITARGQQLFERFSALDAPVVALVHGTCVGGGLELALAADVRIISDDSKTMLGLPEVQLGILPGWGGTSRLPEIVGLKQALPMLLTGSSVRSRKAVAIGLAKAAVPREYLLREGVREIEHQQSARDAGHHGPGHTRKVGLMDYFIEGFAPIRNLILKMARKQVMRKAGRLYPAPHAIIDTLRNGFGKPLDVRLKLEREALATLVLGDVCRSLVSIFMRTRDKDRGKPYSEAPKTSGVNSVTVIGGGVMGSGIATLLLLKGKEVRIVDPFPEALGRAMKSITTELDGRVRRRHMDRRARERVLSALSLSTDFDGVRGADLIIEAVPEVPDIKRDALQQCAARLAPNALLTSNTSSLSLTTLEGHVKDPSRFAGLHFFNPAPRMPLIEIVPSGGTADSTTLRLIRFCKEIGKTPVLSTDSPAFIVNRLLAPYLVAAATLAMEGADIKSIDRVAKRFGLPMGPFALMDTVGLDIASHVCDYLSGFAELGIERPDLLGKMVDAGRLGRKSGRGFYDYSKKRKKLCTDTPGLPAETRAISDNVIKSRLLDALSDEARRIMDEGVVITADDLDLASIFGMGFPPYTAGIATWAGLQPSAETQPQEVIS